MEPFTVVDGMGSEITVVVEEGGAIAFYPFFVRNENSVSHIDPDFSMYYPEDAALNVALIWDSFPKEQQHLLGNILEKAKKDVEEWAEIKNPEDKKAKELVLATYQRLMVEKVEKSAFSEVARSLKENDSEVRAMARRIMGLVK